ncbi:hypothetical protein FJT64_002440 [Amphibalanus amphitrite]|uniref:Uncharacterized protein n=1 Tax=Amphibalanus amphitrite TaxID=1232801 RepID=A0A6A4WRL8_AMPAM|nr:hypothetical protein FJT64_002440 [Amphibalanus amphitrite]
MHISLRPAWEAMETEAELRQRKGARGGQKTQDAVTGKVVQGDELVTSGLNTLKSLHQSLASQVSGLGQLRATF